jgi:hypothetical protein
VTMDSIQFSLGPPCLTLLPPAGGPPLKRLFGYFRGGSPTGRADCGRLNPFGNPTPFAYERKSNLAPREGVFFHLGESRMTEKKDWKIGEPKSSNSCDQEKSYLKARRGKSVLILVDFKHLDIGDR